MLTKNPCTDGPAGPNMTGYIFVGNTGDCYDIPCSAPQTENR